MFLRRSGFIPAALFVCLGLSAAFGAGEKIRVACVGDSITFGEGVEHAESNAYPAVLARLLGDGFDVRNFGVSGATAQKTGTYPYWSLPEFEAATQFNPQLVVIMLGSNDSKLRDWRSREEFIADLAALVDHFREIPARPRVWLCRPPPAYGFFFAIRDSVLQREIVPCIDQVAREKGLGVIDIRTLLSGKSDLFPDAIHPNAEGAQLIAEAVYQALNTPGVNKDGPGASKVE